MVSSKAQSADIDVLVVRRLDTCLEDLAPPSRCGFVVLDVLRGLLIQERQRLALSVSALNAHGCHQAGTVRNLEPSHGFVTTTNNIVLVATDNLLLVALFHSHFGDE